MGWLSDTIKKYQDSPLYWIQSPGDAAMHRATGIGGAQIGTAWYPGIAGALDKDSGGADQNYLNQKEFAQHGIRWKVEDAMRAGIHPMYALSAQGASYSPSYVGGDTGPDMAALSQDINRAINQTRTSDEQEFSKLQLATAQANLDGQLLDNQYKATQLQRLQTGPSFPGSQTFIPGQGDSNLVNEKAFSRTKSNPGSPHMEPGAINSTGYYMSSDGGLTPVSSTDAKERLEDSPQELVHFYQNNILPNFGNRDSAPPENLLRKGQYWRWSTSRQRWVPSSKGGKTNVDYFKDTKHKWYRK